MEFGVHLPDAGQLATREAMLAYARTAEESGYASVWSSDHIAWPDPASLASRYPYAEDNSGFPPAGLALARLHRLAAVRGGRHRAGAPRHDRADPRLPGRLAQAKAWATLDHLSGGRAILGVGVGWMREEFEAIGMPWDQRGRRADETLEIFEALWSQEEVHLRGALHPLRPGRLLPQAAQRPHPGLGRRPHAARFRRTARLGDAFHAAFRTVEGLSQQWRDGGPACESIGRDPAEVELTMLCTLLVGGHSDRPGVLCGSSDQLVEQLAAYQEIGVRHTVLFVAARGGLEGRLDAIRSFATEVAPQLA